MKNVIITGADGFVGSYTVEYFLNMGVNVLALDMGEKPQRLTQREGLTYLRCDVTDAEGMKKMIPAGVYDAFIHFAWAGSAGPARVDYDLQMNNALTTVACLKTARKLGCQRFVCAGSIMEKEVEAAVHDQGSRQLAEGILLEHFGHQTTHKHGSSFYGLQQYIAGKTVAYDYITHVKE